MESNSLSAHAAGPESIVVRSSPMGLWKFMISCALVMATFGSVLASAKQEGPPRYGWIPHNAGFGFLDLAPSKLHSNWFWDYIS
jgi:hypothetical protein